ncbi:phosphatidate cytidylyltransferase [Rickettsiales bacterium LUAb2]
MENKVNSKFNDFKLRLLSSIILLPLVIWLTIGGGVGYFVLLIVAAYLAAKEWAHICGGWSLGFDGMSIITFVCIVITAFYMKSIVLGFVCLAIGVYVCYFAAKLRGNAEKKHQLSPSYLNRPLFYAIGLIYLSLAFGGLAYLPNVDHSNYTVLWIFGLVVCSDVSAYIFGNLIGGKKLAPTISPGKTWSGFIFAMITTFIVSYIVASLLNFKNVLDLSILGAVVVIIAHIGDLLESALKRYLKIKDTGNLIPGHGGILDRIDALALVAIVIFFITLITNQSILHI